MLNFKVMTQWFSSALFNRSASSYFEPLLSPLMPMLPLTSDKAKVVSRLKQDNEHYWLTLRTARLNRQTYDKPYILITTAINGRRLSRRFKVDTAYTAHNKRLLQVLIDQPEHNPLAQYLIQQSQIGDVLDIHHVLSPFDKTLSKDKATIQIKLRDSEGEPLKDTTLQSNGQPILHQALKAGIKPVHGCRRGLCHQCSAKKTKGVVKNIKTGERSLNDEEMIQMCLSVPLSDVDVELSLEEDY